MTTYITRKQRKKQQREQLKPTPKIIPTETLKGKLPKPTLEIEKDKWKAKGETKPTPYILLQHQHFKPIILSTREMQEILQNPDKLTQYTKIPKYLQTDIINLIEETLKEAETETPKKTETPKPILIGCKHCGSIFSAETIPEYCPICGQRLHTK